jgi:hypothetical protein
MHKLTLLLAAGAVGALAVSVASRAEAGALAGAEGLRIAIDDVSNIQKVHCVPGFAHRRSPPFDGCWRRAYRAWGPGWGYGWRRPIYRSAWGHPGWGGYGWRRPIYGAAWGPGIGVGIGVGRPWGWGGHRGWGWGGPRVGIGFGWGW